MNKPFKMQYSILLFFIGWMSISSIAQSQEQAVELGEVDWLRNYDQAVDRSRKNGKAILILFQEVPGCQTCRKYGKQVLSHPLIVEAVEEYFVPLAIHNNKGGEDARILQHFGEPSWNNPVVRIVNDKGSDLVPRLSGSYHPAALVETIKIAFQIRGETFPDWLELVLREERAKANGTETAYLGMYCFWTGEKEIGGIDGVVDTEAGFMKGGEVVEVTYDPQQTDLKSIASIASESDCADRVYSNQRRTDDRPGTFRSDSEPKYYLSKTAYAALPMTDLQKVKANRAIGQGQSPDRWLSPGQVDMYQCLKEKEDPENRISLDFRMAWDEVEEICK